jgi:hypothetical protein
MTVGDIFYVLEQAKANLNLETYSLSQTTLEQVFVYFAKKQTVAYQVTGIGRVAINVAENQVKIF